VAFFLSGCAFTEQLQREWDALQIILRGGKSPLARKFYQRPEASPSPDSLSAGSSYSWGAAARASLIHRELFYEVFKVVIQQEPNAEIFSGYVNVLNQGASLEGVYNGLVHSSAYRQLEIRSPRATSSALRVFSELLAELEGALANPTEFDAGSAQPLTVLSADRLNNNEETDVQAAGEEKTPIPQDYKKIFEKASFYTLKRVLGDEALKVLAAKRSDAQQVGAWYGKWAARMAAYRLDYGLEPRNRADEGFHSTWAMHAAEESVKWEVLNRLHRVMNDAQNKP
jgi:hypothetical protein